MILTHAGHAPSIDADAWIAPNAVICGDVTIGAGARIAWGAQVIAEGGAIHIGRETIVLENAVLRSTPLHDLSIGDHCVIGPNTHVAGCTVEDGVFIATGASVFHAAHVGAGSEVRINAVVHLRTRLPAGATVPIGWVAVGDPVEILPPGDHERIWAIQRPLDFPQTVYGIPRAEVDMAKIAQRMSDWLGAHRDDVELPSGS